MLATRTLIGMIVGGLIIGLGGYSLVDTLGAGPDVTFGGGPVGLGLIAAAFAASISSF